MTDAEAQYLVQVVRERDALRPLRNACITLLRLWGSQRPTNVAISLNDAVNAIQKLIVQTAGVDDDAR